MYTTLQANIPSLSMSSTEASDHAPPPSDPVIALGVPLIRQPVA